MSDISTIPTNDQPDFTSNLAGRHRTGNFWRAVFRLSTVVGVIALALLLLNVGNSTIGYAAITYKIHPDDLAINNIPLENLHQNDLAYILKQNITPGTYQNFENEKPFVERSQEEIYDLVVANVVQPKVLGTWKLLPSLTDKDLIYQEAADKYAEKFPIMKCTL